MNEKELSALLDEYKRLKISSSDITAKLEAIEKQIKALMGEKEELRAGVHRVVWSHYETSRFNSKAFKQRHPTIFNRFTITTRARRFTVS